MSGESKEKRDQRDRGRYEPIENSIKALKGNVILYLFRHVAMMSVEVEVIGNGQRICCSNGIHLVRDELFPSPGRVTTLGALLLLMLS